MPFSHPVLTEWCDDGRSMVVIAEITYTDPAGREWKAPAGLTTDGASIPEALWSLIGSPFTGRYRLPAIFHDAAYSTLGVSKDDADSMFLAAMLEAGCSQWMAEVIYEAVRFGGLEPYAEAQRRAAESVQPIHR